MMIQNVLQSGIIGIGVPEVPEIHSILAKSGCAAAAWQRQPSPAFQQRAAAFAPFNCPADRKQS